VPNPSWNAWAPGFVGILPQKLPLGSTENPLDMRVQFTPEIGAPIITSPVTKEPSFLPVPRWVFREFQWLKLIEFYETQLYGGAVPFDWDNPWTQPSGASHTKTFQFAHGGKPQIVSVEVPRSPVGNTLAGEPTNQRIVVVSCTLLLLPYYP
jgi:hypothetical protein